MQLLFISATSAHQSSLLGMAQLSAAFGQQVTVAYEQPPVDDAQYTACEDTGIEQHLAPDTKALRQLIDQADRVVRL